MNTELGVHRPMTTEETFVLKPDVGKKASPKKLSPILCNLSLPPGCDVTLLASPGLCEDAPVALLLGGGEGEGEGPVLGGVRTLQVALRACAGRQGMLQAARIAFAEAFRRAREHHSKGVYLIGHGIGALFAAKLLADKQFFEECPSSHLLQAVFLISGIYNFNNESLRSLLKTGESTNDEKQTSPPQNITRRPTMITNLVSDHQSFDDRNNLSFICDLSNRCSQFDNTVFSEFKKCKPVHGIELTPEETIKNSPIFQQVAGFNTKPVKMECAGKKCDERNNLSSSLEEIEIIQMLSNDSIDFSPLFDDYKHLQRMAMRVYVLAAEKDGACISKQSRDMFECLAEGCDQEDMHFEVKAKVDRRDVRELLKEEDNFLKRLIRYDIVKYLQ